MIFPQFGVLREIISDRGSHFANKLFQALLAKYGVHHEMGFSYHPKSTSQGKKSNREVKLILEKTVK